jgi:hypothetical protein
MTDKKPEALRLAELLDGDKSAHHEESATELRRQHEEINALLNGASVHLKGALEIYRLHALNQELLEALKVLVANGGIGSEDMFDDARAAIAKAEGESK